MTGSKKEDIVAGWGGAAISTITGLAQALFSGQRAMPWRVAWFCEREVVEGGGWECSNFYQMGHNDWFLPGRFHRFFWCRTVWSDSKNQGETTSWLCFWFIAGFSSYCQGLLLIKVSHSHQTWKLASLGSSQRKEIFHSTQLWNVCHLQLHLYFYFI